MPPHRRRLTAKPSFLMITAALVTLSANSFAENRGGEPPAYVNGNPAAAAGNATPAVGSHIGRSAAPQDGQHRTGNPRHDLNHRGSGRAHHVFQHYDLNRFNRADLVYWRRGRWDNSCRGGQCGWWWHSGGQWYLYDRPTYPYPTVVSAVHFLEPVASSAPPTRRAGFTPLATGPGHFGPRMRVAPLTIQHAQSLLNIAGYSVGDPDGIFGSRSRQQLKKFQSDHGLPATGELDPPTVATLNR